MATTPEYDPAILKPSLVDADGNLKPGETTASYSGGVPQTGDLKPGLAFPDGTLRASLVDADGNLKPGLLSVDGPAGPLPPVLSGATALESGETTASGGVNTNKSTGTLYYLATVNATESATTIKAGASQAVSAPGAQGVSFTGLNAGTTYFAHYVHTDAVGDSNVVSSAAFTTDAPPVVQSPTGYLEKTAFSRIVADTMVAEPDYSTDPFTIEMYVEGLAAENGTGDYCEIAGCGERDTQFNGNFTGWSVGCQAAGYTQRVGTPDFSFAIADGNGQKASVGIGNPNAAHLILSFDPATGTLSRWKNGTKATSTNGSLSTPVAWAESTLLRIGGNNKNLGTALGLPVFDLQFFRFWNGQPTDGEAATAYTDFAATGSSARPTFATATCAIEWLMGALTTGKVEDTSGNANHGTIANQTTVRTAANVFYPSGTIRCTSPTNTDTGISGATRLEADGLIGTGRPMSYRFRYGVATGVYDVTTDWTTCGRNYVRPRLEPSTEYFWQCQCRDAAATPTESSWSDEFSFTTRAATTHVVRPRGATYGTSTGEDYTNAYSGFLFIGGQEGEGDDYTASQAAKMLDVADVAPADTIDIRGDHGAVSGTTAPAANLVQTETLSVTGTATSPVTIKTNDVTNPGRLVSAWRWTGSWAWSDLGGGVFSSTVDPYGFRQCFVVGDGTNTFPAITQSAIAVDAAGRPSGGAVTSASVLLPDASQTLSSPGYYKNGGTLYVRLADDSNPGNKIWHLYKAPQLYGLNVYGQYYDLNEVTSYGNAIPIYQSDDPENDPFPKANVTVTGGQYLFAAGDMLQIDEGDADITVQGGCEIGYCNNGVYLRNTGSGAAKSGGPVTVVASYLHHMGPGAVWSGSSEWSASEAVTAGDVRWALDPLPVDAENGLGWQQEWISDTTRTTGSGTFDATEAANWTQVSNPWWSEDGHAIGIQNNDGAVDVDGNYIWACGTAIEGWCGGNAVGQKNVTVDNNSIADTYVAFTGGGAIHFTNGGNAVGQRTGCSIDTNKAWNIAGTPWYWSSVDPISIVNNEARGFAYAGSGWSNDGIRCGDTSGGNNACAVTFTGNTFVIQEDVNLEYLLEIRGATLTSFSADNNTYWSTSTQTAATAGLFNATGYSGVSFNTWVAGASYDQNSEWANPDATPGTAPSTLDFDGVDHFLQRTDLAYSTTALSVVAKINTTSNAGTICGQYDYGTADRGWQIGPANTGWSNDGTPDGNELALVLSSDGTYTLGTTATVLWVDVDIFDGFDHYVGFTFDAGTVKMFIDGVSQTMQVEGDASITAIYNSSADFTIGCQLNNGSPSTNLFNGGIADVRVYNAVLSEADMLDIATNGLKDTVSTNPLAHYPLDAGYGAYVQGDSLGTTTVPVAQPTLANNPAWVNVAHAVLDGVDDWGTAPAIDTSTATTLRWIGSFHTSDSDSKLLCQYDTNGERCWLLETFESRLRLSLSHDGTTVRQWRTNATNVVNGTWKTLSLKVDTSDNTVTCYIAGSWMAGSWSSGGTTYGIHDTTALLSFGTALASGAQSGGLLTGKLANWRILVDGEVARHYRLTDATDELDSANDITFNNITFV